MNTTYPVNFEASRPFWFQMPSSIQISAAKTIVFSGGNYTQMGAGGFGIGNDPNAHITGVGLGATNVSVLNGYFTQVMGNSITAGGVQANAHHPNDTRMINSDILIGGNIFYNTSSLFSSTVPILATYVQYSNIINNDINFVPYSGICHGYGWGSNDAGGSGTYMQRGLYNYQPIYETPTTSLNNRVSGNIVQNFGYGKTDLGALYTLSKSPSTVLENNYVLNSVWYGTYLDEGSNSLSVFNNTLFSSGPWYYPHEGNGINTGNNTVIDNSAWTGGDFINQPNSSAAWGNTGLTNFRQQGLQNTPENAQRVAYRAGIFPANRGSRPVSNPALIDTYLGLAFPTTLPGNIVVTMSNFDDEAFTAVSYTATVNNGYTLEAAQNPSSILGNSIASLSWKIAGSTCEPADFAFAATYTNSRTGVTRTVSISGTMPGVLPLDNALQSSYTWPTQWGEICGIYSIRTSGRDIFYGIYPNDDFGALYKTAAIGSQGSVTAYVRSLEDIDPWSKAGVVVRNSLANAGSIDDTSLGYATVLITPGNGVSFQYDANGDGFIDTYPLIEGIVAPIWVRLNVSGNDFSGFYSSDGETWVQIGGTATLNTRRSTSDAGIIADTHAGFLNGTARFSNVTFA